MASGLEWPPRQVGGSSARGVRRDETDSPPERNSTDRRFRPKYRLRRRKDFAKVFSGGIRLNARVVTTVVRPNGVNHPRLGLAVARRSARRAVARHRLKRRIRESFRHHAGRLGGLDVVVIVNPGAEKMDSKRFRELLAQQWERVVRLAHRNGRGSGQRGA